MPKHFEITIQVEEVALGRVMRLLHNTPGVVTFDFDMGDPAPKSNGHAGKGVPKKHYEITGEDLMIQMLAKKGPMRSTQLKEAFGKAGRAPASIASVLHKLKTQGLISSSYEGYTLTRKMKDRLRHRKEA